MRCRACNRKLESIQFYPKLGRYEDLCSRCLSAAASYAYDLHPAAAAAITGRLAKARGPATPSPKTRAA